VARAPLGVAKRRPSEELVEEIDSLLDIRPPHSTHVAQWSDEWYACCGKAFLACVDYLRICDLLFTPKQVTKLEAFCAKHGIELGAAIVQVFQLGFSRQFEPPIFRERFYETLCPTEEVRGKIESNCADNRINSTSRHRLIVSAAHSGLKAKGVL
jgi:hypothetical protein